MAKLQRIITPKRFIELIADDRINPRGEVRDDLRMARICATIVNASGFRSGPAVQESDFMPKFSGEATPQQSVSDMKKVAKQLAGVEDFD